MTRLRIAVISLFVYGTFAYAGVLVGNGTDNFGPQVGSAWFVDGNRIIDSCYELSPKFGLTPAAVEAKVESAFQLWPAYLKERGVLELMVRQGVRASFSSKLKLHRDCTGQEDLHIYFGVSNPEVNAAKETYDNPTAFALRKSYDPKQGWGKGMIWISPPGEVDTSSGFPLWSIGDDLTKILLHEFGHVFGVPHVRGTIMDEDLSRLLQSKTSIRLQIDQRNQLGYCWRCRTYSYNGTLGYSSASAQRDTTTMVFAKFVGRPAKGLVRAAVEATPSSMTLVLSDDLGKTRLPLGLDFRTDSDAVHSAFDRSERLFKVYLQDDQGIGQSFDFFSGGVVVYGEIKDAIGKKLSLVAEVNSHSLGSPGPLTLRWLEAGVAHSLFFAEP